MVTRLRELREAAGLTQKALADAIASSESYISRIESEQYPGFPQTDTEQRLCKVLGCKPYELYAKIEYDEDGKIIIDDLWCDFSHPQATIVQIGSSFFSTRHDYLNKTEDLLKHLTIVKKPLAETADTLSNMLYIGNCISRRGGYGIKIRAAITPEEFENFKRKYPVVDETDEFIMTLGAIYGARHAKQYTAKQYKLKEPGKSIDAEEYLRGRGIQADNCAHGVINIRVK